MQSSILPPQIQGVMFITGKRGLGKSYLASQADLPQNIGFLDFEEKGRGIDSDLHFGLYRALTVEAVESKRGLFSVAWDCFTGLPKNTFTTVILDNVSPLEDAMGAEAANNARKYAELYGLNADKIKKNAWGHQSAVVNRMIGDLCPILHSRGVRLIIATSHVKSQWYSGQPVPGKFRFKGADRWQELSILTLILTPGIHPPTPSAIVQKEQLGKIEIDRDPTPEQIEAMLRGEDGHKPMRRLPYRLPEATFQKIRWYLHHPANLGNPAEGEAVVGQEVNEFDEGLSKEQLQFVTAAIENETLKMREESGEAVPRPAGGKAFTPPGAKEPDPTVVKAEEDRAKVKEMAKTMTAGEVAEELGLALPVVMAMLEG